MGKEIYKEFAKFWLSMQIPLYGSILYVMLMYFDYVVAWAITNTVFAVIMFPFQRKYIFRQEK